MRSSVFVTCLLLAAVSAGAQGSASSAVRGVVFDSVAGTPLAGAVVQVALSDSGPSAPGSRVYSATSDSIGRYHIQGLALGRYVIGFQHDVLLALGIESPLRAFSVAGPGVISLDLATPSPDVLRAARCGPAADPLRSGMLSGFVTDARSGAVPGGGSVEVQWTEIGVRDRKIRAVPFSVRADIAEDGSYLACNLTTDAMLSVRVAALGRRTLNGELVVPLTGVMRRDFTLADTGAVAGSGRVTGRVLLADGRPLASGQVHIASLGIEAPVTDGQFSIAGLPAGTWLVDARAIGYEPRSALVDVADAAAATVAIRLNARAQVLDAVTVVGKSNMQEISILEGIQQRARMGSGTVFGPGSAALKTATFPADVIRYARGFKYLSASLVHGRAGSMLSDTPLSVCADARCRTMRPDSSVIGNTFSAGVCSSDREGVKKRFVVLYLNGDRFSGGLDMLNTTVAMQEVLAIEAYPDVASAPPIWRTPEACAIIAVWTKR